MKIDNFKEWYKDKWILKREDIYSPHEALIGRALRRRLRETGTLSLIPRTFAFKAVQRQAAASRSTKPLRLSPSASWGRGSTEFKGEN